MILLINLNIANKKDVQGPLETVWQNIRAKSLVSKLLTNMFLILKRNLENSEEVMQPFSLTPEWSLKS